MKNPQYLVWLFALLVSCSTDQCSCGGWETRNYPVSRLDKTVPSAGQVRLTPTGIDYVEEQVPYLIDQFLPDGLNFCIPENTSSNPAICVDSTCGNGARGCQVGLVLEDREIRTIPANKLEVGLTISMNQRLNFDYQVPVIGTVNCYVQVFKRGSSESTRGNIIGDIPITLGIDGTSPTKELQIDIGDVGLNLDDIDFKIHGRGNVGDTIACEGASLVRGLFRGMIESEIRTILDETVTGIADQQTCTRCGGEFGTCRSGTCQEGICRYASDACVPRPLGVEGRLQMGSLLGDFTAAPAAAVDVLAKAGDHAIVDTGVSVGMRAGFDPVSIHECVPADPTRRPPSNAVAVSPVINANQTPDNRPFHLSVGIHRRAVEQLLWSTWSSGVACLDVSTEDVAMLTTTTFQIAAPSLKDVVTGNSLAVMAIVPQKAPTVEFGENTVRQENGATVIEQPLMTLIWEDLDIHVFGWAQDRMARLFTLRVDFRLPVALSPVAGQIIPVIPPLESGITNIRARRTELVSEPPQRIVDIVPLLLGFAAPQLAGAIPEAIDVPEFLGFRLDLAQRDITGADKNEFLALFARLARSGAPFGASVDTFVEDHHLDVSQLTPSGLIRPAVVARVGALSLAHDAPEFEYQWRVDGGFWSYFHTGPELRIDDPLLMAPGLHRVEIRGRVVGEPESLDLTASVVEVNIDMQPPLITVQEHDNAVTVTAEDDSQVLPQTRFRVVGIEEWSDWTHGSKIDLSNLPRGPRVRLVIEARDAAGLVSQTDHVIERPQTAPTQAGCATSNSSPFSWLLMLGILAFGRRRKGWLLTLLLGLWGVGCKGEVSTNFAGQNAQACVLDSDCSGTCPEDATGICEGDRCRCVSACLGGCGADEFCCVSANSCMPNAPVCDMPCDPGYESRVVGTLDRQTCEVDGGCQCVPLPPIPLGVHGQHLSLDAQGELIAVAALNKTYNDLMVGTVRADNSVDWMFVDGLPETGAIEGDPNGPRGGTKAPGDVVGSHTAIGIDRNSGIHVVYRDDTNKTLRYARGIRVGEKYDWEISILEAENEPFWPSLVVEAETVHVIYGRQNTRSELVHRTFGISEDPTTSLVTVIDSADVSEENRRSYPVRMGVFTDISLVPGGGVFAVWWNGISERVGRSTFVNDVWSEPTYLAAGTGPYAGGRKDAQGREHVVFQQSKGLRYSRFNDGTITAQVHSGLRDGDEYFTGAIGESARLSLQGEQVVVAFQDAFDRSLHTAVFNGESFDVTKAPLPATEAQGFYSKISSDGRVVAHFVIDRTQEPWGFVRVERR